MINVSFHVALKDKEAVASILKSIIGVYDVFDSDTYSYFWFSGSPELVEKVFSDKFFQ